MEFLKWHYSEGFTFYIKRWIFTLRFISHYFSLQLLLETLFSPWKRLETEDNLPGFSISRYFENLTFNLISRGIGAIVRTILFFAGLILLLIIFIGGGFGIIVWVVLPFVGLPAYMNLQNRPQVYVGKLMRNINDGQNPFNVFFTGEAGKFFVAHLGLTTEEFKEITLLEGLKIPNFTPVSYKDIIEKLIQLGAWKEDLLRRKSLSFEDLTLTAKWWDTLKLREAKLDGDGGLGRPGIGLDLLFGYIPILSQYSIDLSAARPFSHRLIGRDDVV